ncbi:hypothetical protein J7E70_08015 [Variovorax paradoxus]|nr:hypothetical protein [Variovorax paradoxus]MBT2300409.1 hypothetical protein [Variovorax paradoxus]
MNFQDTQFADFQDDSGMFITDWLGYLIVAFILTVICAAAGIWMAS